MKIWFPIKEEYLTPQQFLSLSDKEKANIKETQIIPPTLGKPGFGKIKVIYRFAKLPKWLLPMDV